MWQKPQKKMIYLLNIGNYAPEITEITYPFIKQYADKIHANVCMITERKFPDWPITYEKLQIYALAQEHANDWNIYIDSDALVHPDTLDFTQLINKDTILHNGADMGLIRWHYDRYFWRSGSHFGSCNWWTIASDWCIELWQPLDLTPEEAIRNIAVTAYEFTHGITCEHLVDDYALSRNIARYGLKTQTIAKLLPSMGMTGSHFFHHQYTEPIDEKLRQIKAVVKTWGFEKVFIGQRDTPNAPMIASSPKPKAEPLPLAPIPVVVDGKAVEGTA